MIVHLITVLSSTHINSIYLLYRTGTYRFHDRNTFSVVASPLKPHNKHHLTCYALGTRGGTANQHNSVPLQQLLISNNASSSLNSFIMVIPKYARSVWPPTWNISTFQQCRSPLLSNGKPPPILQDPTSHLQDHPTHTRERSEAIGSRLPCELAPFSPTSQEDE